MRNNSPKIFSFFSICLVLNHFAFSQCEDVSVEAFISKTEVVCGDTIKLSALGSSVVAFEEDFNDNNIDGWVNTPSGSFQTNICCEPSPDNSVFYWFGGSANSPRYAETPPLSLQTGGQIHFNMRFSYREPSGSCGGDPGIPNDCEDPDAADEGVHLQYNKNDGTGWQEIDYWAPAGISSNRTSPYRTWTYISRGIPADAMQNGVSIRWVQLGNTGDAINGWLDHWGIDDVLIEVNPADAQYTWEHTGITRADGSTPDVVPTQSTDYIIDYFFEGCNVKDTVSVDVSKLQIDAIIDPGTALCPGETDTIVVTTEFDPPKNCGPTDDCIGNSATIRIDNNGAGGIVDNNYQMFGVAFTGGSSCSNLNGIYSGNSNSQARTQFIIRASDFPLFFQESGGQFFDLALNTTNAGNWQNLSIRMGCSSVNGYSQAGDNQFVGGLTTVFGPANVSLSNGWTTFPFSQMYEWDGKENLVIQFCWYGNNNKVGNVRKHDAGFNSVVHAATCFEGAAQCNNGIAMDSWDAIDNLRPDVTFGVCYRQKPNLQYTWTPPLDVVIPDPTDSSRAEVSPSNTRIYNVEVWDRNTPKACAVNDQEQALRSPLGSFKPSYNEPVCEGGQLDLQANIPGMTTYDWNGPLAFNSPLENPTVTVNATQAHAGSYSLFVDNGSCSNTEDVTVVVEIPPKAGTPRDTILCSSSEPLDLFTLLTDFDAGSWTDNDGSGALTGSNFRAQNLDPADLPATFNFTHKVDINSCGERQTSLSITVNYQPSPGEDGEFEYCETGGAIDLFDLLTDDADLIGSFSEITNSGQLTGSMFDLTDLGGETYEFEYLVSATAPCGDSVATLTIEVMDQLNAGKDADASVCLGGTINLFSQLGGAPNNGGKWVDLDNSGGSLTAANGNFDATGASPGFFRFRYEIKSDEPCVPDSSIITLEIKDAPVIGELTTECTPDRTAFTATFEIIGGDVNSYVVNPSGTLYPGNPYTFVSDPIPSGELTNFTVEDIGKCAVAEVKAQKHCLCTTDAGVMKADTIVNVCVDGVAKGLYNGGFVNDSNDVYTFYLHEGNSNSLSNIIDSSNTPEFTFNPATMEVGKSYYISVAAGNDNGSGFVDRNDQCFHVVKGTQIIFRPLPDAVMSVSRTEICPAEPVDVEFEGELGSAPYRIKYSLDPVGGENVFEDSGTGNTPHIINPTDTTTIRAVHVTDKYGCFTSLTQVEIVNINVAPSAKIVKSGNACNGNNPSFEIQVSGAGSYFEVEYMNSYGNKVVERDITPQGRVIYPSLQSQYDTVNYWITQVSDNSGSVCAGFVSSDSETYTLFPTPSAEIVNSNFTYCEGMDMSIELNLTGLGPWEVELTEDVLNGTYTIIANSSNFVGIIPDDIPAGVYNFSITSVKDLGSSQECSSNGFGTPAQIKINPAPRAEAYIDNSGALVKSQSICENGNAELVIKVTQGSSSSYEVDYLRNGNLYTETIASNQEFRLPLNNLTSSEHLYIVTAVRDNSPSSCPGVIQDTARLIVNANPHVTGGIVNPELCEGEEVSLLFNASGTGDITFDVVEGNTILLQNVSAVAGNQDTLKIPSQNIGPHSYSIENVKAGTNPTCFGTGSTSLFAEVKAAPRANMTLNNQTTPSICYGDEILLDITTIGSGNITYDLDTNGVLYKTLSGVAGDENTYKVEDVFAPGNYTFGITRLQDNSQAQCSYEQNNASVSIVVNSLPDVNPAFTDPVCENQVAILDIGITSSAFNTEVEYTDGTNTYTGVYTSNQDDEIQVLADKPKTIEITRIRDANGCESIFTDRIATVVLNPNPIVTMGHDVSVCDGITANIDFVITGSGPYTVDFSELNKWGSIINTHTEQMINGTNKLSFTPTDTTGYTVAQIVDDLTGCTSVGTDTAFINIKPNPDAQFNAVSLAGCPPFETKLQVNNPGYYPVISHTWDVSGGILINDTNGYGVQYANSGSYDIGLTIENSVGCTDTEIKRSYITVDVIPDAYFTFTPREPDILNSLVMFNNQSIGAYYYNWLFDSLASVVDRVNPMYEFPGDGDVTYNVCLEAYSSYKCKDVYCVPVTIKEKEFIYVPNTFTPNNDDINEEFLPVLSGMGVEKFEMYIVTRWGENLFYTNRLDKGWDGTFNGKEVLEGVYAVLINVTWENGQDDSYVGMIKLNR